MAYHLVTSLPKKICKKENYLFLDSTFLKSSKIKDINFYYKIFNLNDKNLILTKKIIIDANKNYLNLLKLFSLVLNDYHNTNFNTRYWEIIIGHWLSFYNMLISYKVVLLEKIFLNYQIKKITLLKPDDLELVSNDTISSIWATNSNKLNDYIVWEILKYNRKYSKIVNFEQSQSLGKEKINNVNSIKLKFLDYISKLHSFRNSEMIIDTHLSKFENLKLNFVFKNFFPNNIDLITLNYKPSNRQKLFKILNNKKFKNIDPIFINLLPKLIPSSFVENYKYLAEKLKHLNWPSSPSFIFTSSAFFGNEVFKVWLANMVNKNVKYYVGQHGNNYGTHFYYGNKNCVERRTCNHFISWGWQEKKTNVIKGFYFKKSLRRKDNYTQGGLLVINTSIEHNFVPWDTVDYYLKRLNYVKTFLLNLPPNICTNTILRFTEKVNNFNCSQLNDIDEIFKKVQKDYKRSDLQDLIKKNRLTVFSYDSTGMLQYLNSDIPFIGFWPNFNDHILTSKRHLYDLLYKNKILFKDPYEASKFVAANWNGLDHWWEAKEVKIAKLKFKECFAKNENNISKSLAEILKSY